MKRILNIFPVWLSLAFFFACLVCSPSWGACNIVSSSGVFANCQSGNRDGFCKTGTSYTIQTGCSNACSSVSYWCDGGDNAPIIVPISASATNCDWFGDGGRQGRFNITYYSCTNQCEADSLKCLNDGGTWDYDGGATCGGMYCNMHQCDTTFNCVEYPFERCEDVPSSGEVYCDENGCTGLPYSRWWSEYRKECSNECGEHMTESVTSDTLITFDSSCDDSLKCSSQQFCVDFPSSGSYYLYTKCSVGNEQVGNVTTNRVVPNIVSSGRGSCASLGMPSTNFPNSGNSSAFPNSNNNNSVLDNCLVYGIGCPENFADTSNYNDSDNRNPEHCICEPLDGSHFTSTIICPDGTRSTFWGSCDDWRGAFSSSSAPSSSSSANPPESSSSGSENPPASSGGISGEYPDWNVIYRNQNNTNTALGSIVQSVKTMAVDVVAGVKSLLSGYDYNYTDSYPDLVAPDSMLQLDTILDTAGLLHAVFGRIDSNNTILDTLQHSSFTGCPCITFFAGNTQNSITMGHLVFKEIKFNLGDFHGFNLCRIISAVVVALASVVSFFIGFAIFKNVSQ